MATDLKMEIFAYNIFNNLWLKSGVRNTEMSIFQIYGDECMKDSTYTEVCDAIFDSAITCRRILFIRKYSEEIDLDYVMNCKSLSEFFDFLTHLCDREDMFGHLTVFEKMFATCTFVFYFSHWIYHTRISDIVNYSHIIWAMYFDKFSDQFYKEGGWNELKRVAKTYDLIFNFFYILSETNPFTLKEAAINYLNFKNAVKYVNCKKMHKGKIPISYLWIKFQTEHFEERVTISSEYFASIFEVELLLQDLQLIFNFSSECDSDNAKLLEDKLDQKRISCNLNESFCNEIPNGIDNFEAQQNEEILASSEKDVNHEIINKIENFGCKNDSEEGMLGRKSDINLGEYSHNACSYLYDRTKLPRFENSTKIVNSDFDYDFKNKSFDSEGEKGLEDISSARNLKRPTEAMNAKDISSANFERPTEAMNAKDISSANFERPTEAMNAKDILPTNQKEEYELPKQISPKNLPNLKEFHSKDEIIKRQNERENSCRTLKSNFCSKYEKACNEGATLTVKEMAAAKSEENEIPKKLSCSKDFLTGNKVIKSEERVNTNVKLDELRKERDDPEICSLLRMILVLGDKQGIQLVNSKKRKNKKKKLKVKKKNSDGSKEIE